MPQDRFASDNPYTLTQQLMTAVNNNTAFNVSLAENDALRATSAQFATQALTRTPVTPLPDVTQTAQNTIGAALAGINQPEINPLNDPVDPCFVYATPILMANGTEKPIGEVEIGDWVKAFDRNGLLINVKVIGKHIKLTTDSLLVRFADRRITHTNAVHRYWVLEDVFAAISLLDEVQHWNGTEWRAVNIIDKEPVFDEILLYNLDVDVYHTYIANGDGVHNLKPLEEGF
jgi:hypothetical protein